jgi:hypothetical protein
MSNTPKEIKKEIKKDSIVCYKDGWKRVSARFKNTVNLKSVWGSKTLHKQVPLSEVKEDEEAWYNRWTESEHYKCM